jgi:hypothetical protein
MASNFPRITSNVKIAEFPEMADALYAAFNSDTFYGSQKRWELLELIQKQSQAKQDKFWKFYDAFVLEMEAK